MTVTKSRIGIHFSDYFDVEPSVIADYGAFNISLINDLPLFVDPFLLFNSTSNEYQELHEGMIRYLRFLKDKAVADAINPGLRDSWFKFPEVRQNWFGYSKFGNAGHGLGSGFAVSLTKNLSSVFSTFGDEQVTRGSHLEKLLLLDDGIGRDSISDFTTNLIKGFLVDYTEQFATEFVQPAQTKRVVVDRVTFNYFTESWMPKSAVLPWFAGDFVLLTPRDILTRHDVWISRSGLMDDLASVIESVPNMQLRARLNNYLMKVLPEEPSKADRQAAVSSLIRAHPEVVEHFIRRREDTGEQATERAQDLVGEAEQVFVGSVGELAQMLALYSAFYASLPTSFAEARQRALYFKGVIENKGGHRFFWAGDERLIRRESDLQLMYRLVWYGTDLDVSREVNDGRGPADFKISQGAFDKTIVEFKLASNTQLRRNLANQVHVYQAASDAQGGLHVIVAFSESEMARVGGILEDLDLSGSDHVILVDARRDNKPSGSKA